MPLRPIKFTATNNEELYEQTEDLFKFMDGVINSIKDQIISTNYCVEDTLWSSIEEWVKKAERNSDNFNIENRSPIQKINYVVQQARTSLKQYAIQKRPVDSKAIINKLRNLKLSVFSEIIR